MRFQILPKPLRAAGSALLLAATLFQAGADELQSLWTLSPGDRPYLTTDNFQRGMAYNPATGHVLVVNRSEGVIYILDAADGSDLGTLSIGSASISGGTFPMSMIGTTEDGVIYLANLSTSTTAPNFKLYRWESETAPEPTVAYEGDPAAGANNQRWGDSLDVRGTADNTQILVGSRTGSVAALISSTDGVTHTATLISNAHTAGALGVAFGAGDTIWTKLNGQPLRHVSFDPATGAGTLLREYSIMNNIAPIDVNADSNLLAGINIVRPTGVDDLLLYDIRDLTQDPALVDTEPFPGDADNANYVGSVDLHGDLVFALDTNNGLMAFRVIPTVNPPTFATQPPSPTVLEGGFVTLSASVSGTPPYTYQWNLNGEAIDGATEPSLTLTNVTAGDAGTYTLTVSNAAGSETSADAVVTVAPSVRTSRATVLWKLAPGDLPFLTTGNTERGIAYNKATGNLLVVSRTGGVNVHVLDGDTGEHLHDLAVPTEIVSGSNPGGFRLNMIGVADDGVVFAANLDTGGSTYTIYRWENDSEETQPTVAYTNSGEITGRFGDTFDVRGEGVNTQLLAAYNETGAAQNDPPAVFAVFSTFDGFFFYPSVFSVADAAAGSTRLGAAFGEGDTIWAKAPSQPLRQFSFDTTTLAAATLNTFTEFPTGISAIGVHTSSNLLAGLSLATPDNVHLYDISDLGTGPVLVDQDFFPTDNANANGTGSIDFGGDRLYALDSNNGIIALQLNAPPVGGEPADLGNVQREGDTVTFTLTGSPNTQYRIDTTTDWITWSEATTVTTDATGTAQVTVNSTDQYRFYRAATE